MFRGLGTAAVADDEPPALEESRRLLQRAGPPARVCVRRHLPRPGREPAQ